MSYLDALLGRCLSKGVSVPLRGTLNFEGGVVAATSSRVDVSLALLDKVISLGYQEQYSARNTIISASSTWYDLQVNAPAPLGVCSLNFGGLGFNAGVSWEGAGTATVLAIASFTPDMASGKTMGFRWALNGAEVAGSERQIISASLQGPPVALLTLLELDPSDTLAVQVCNYTDAADLETAGFAAAYVAFGGVDGT